MRQQQKKDEGSKKQFTHVSPRTLLGVLRLSQALARLRFSEEVVNEDVDEALRLIEVSKASLYNDQRSGGDQTVSSRIYDLIRGMRESGAAAVGQGRGELNLNRVKELVLAKGFTSDNLERTIDEYALLDVSPVLNDVGKDSHANNRNRYGKSPTMEHDLFSSRPGTVMTIWAVMMNDLVFDFLAWRSGCLEGFWLFSGGLQ